MEAQKQKQKTFTLEEAFSFLKEDLQHTQNEEVPFGFPDDEQRAKIAQIVLQDNKGILLEALAEELRIKA